MSGPLSLSGTRPRRKAPAGAALFGLASTVLLLLPALAPAAAAALPGQDFADGTSASSLVFPLGGGTSAGPSVRLSTSGVVQNARVALEGSMAFENASLTRDSTSDFAGGERLDGTVAENGKLRLDTTSGFAIYDASNGFGGGVGANTQIAGGNLTLVNASVSGTFSTVPLPAPGGGWGYFSADYECRWLNLYPCGGSAGDVSFDLLRPDGTTLLASILSGTRVPASAFDFDSLAVRISISPPGQIPVCNVQAPDPRSCIPPTPALKSFSFGQRLRSPPGPGPGPLPGWSAATGRVEDIDPTALSKNPNNPIVANKPGTYYSAYLSQPFVLALNGTWTMFVSASTTGDYHGAAIARGVSSDLQRWSMDAAPVIAPGAGYDSYGQTHPYVFENPEGPGYLMYYTAWTSSTAFSLASASSMDGATWTKTGQVITPLSGWESASVGHAARVSYDALADVWTLFYSGTDVTTGGGSALGIATSNDGANWTRYAGNPVLQRGAAFDTGDLQGGKIIDLAGTLNYYYDCTTGSGHYETCLAQSSDGGYTWSKFGVVIAEGTGFESGYASDACPVVGPTGFFVFYAGLSGATSQIGVANGTVWNRSVRWVADMGEDPPLSLDRAISVVQSGGVWMALRLRSSDDGVTWSSSEAISGNDASLSTPARRFVEFSGTERPSAACPEAAGYYCGTLATFELRSTSYRDIGAWLSDALTYSDPFDRARVVTTMGAPGRVDWTLLLGGFAGETPAPERVWVDVVGDLQAMQARARIKGNQSATPTVDAVNFTVRMFGFPADVELGLGANGTSRSVHPGPLSGLESVALSADELNGWIGEALAASPNATFVDVPLLVRSSHFGVVTLSGLEINETFKKRLSALFSPPGRLVINETETASMAVEATTEGAATITYQWFLDGVLQTETGAGFSWLTTYDDAGTHAVHVAVSNGDFTIDGAWEVIVLNLNRPPIIVAAFPGPSTPLGRRGAATFSVNAIDPDGDPLSYSWWLDGGETGASGTNDTTLRGLAIGYHIVEVRVSDGQADTGWAWNITVANAPPIIVKTTPADVRLEAPHGEGVELVVFAVDPDGDALSYAWDIDGVEVRGAAGNQTAIGGATLGARNVTVTVSDGLASAAWTWRVNLTNRAPVIVNRTPDYAGVLEAAPVGVGAQGVDPDGDELSYAWTLDSASSPAWGGGAPTRLDALPPGRHNVTLRVTDPFGAAAVTSWEFNIPPPVQTVGLQFFGGALFFILLFLGAAAAVALYLRYLAGSDESQDRRRMQ